MRLDLLHPRLLPYAVTFGFLGAGALTGLVVATGNLVLIALVIGGLTGLLLLNALPLAVWILLIGVFLINGPVGYFLPGLSKIAWLFSLLGVFMTGAALLYAAAGRERPRHPMPTFVVLALAFAVLAAVGALFSNGSMTEISAGAKRQFQFWGVVLLFALVPFSQAQVRRWLVFLLGVALVQLPLALYQRVILVPQVMGFERPGFVPFDIIVGTFEGSMFGGGASSIMAMYLVVAAVALFCAYRERLHRSTCACRTGRVWCARHVRHTRRVRDDTGHPRGTESHARSSRLVMRGMVATMALSVLFTVEQRDMWRTSIDPASTAVSGDGRHVAFVSFSQLAPADADHLSDVYVLDRTRQQVTLESVEATGPVSVVAHPRLSGDGRILVYQRDDEIIVRNRTANTTTIVGTGRQPTISHDGSTVAFVSEREVYVVRLGTAEPLRVSIAMPGLESIVAASVTPSVSGDGRYVAFASRAAQRPQNQTPTSYVFIRDTHTNVTKRISTGWGPATSGDGRFVTFLDYARNVPHVFLADVVAGTVRAVTNNTRGRLANGGSANPGVSFDGRYVVFQSDANDLTEDEDYNLLPDVFIFDRAIGGVTRVSGDPDEAWLEPSSGPSIDDRGAVVAFSSRHPTDASDKRNDFDLYVATFRQVSDDQLNSGLAGVRQR